MSKTLTKQLVSKLEAHLQGGAGAPGTRSSKRQERKPARLRNNNKKAKKVSSSESSYRKNVSQIQTYSVASVPPLPPLIHLHREPAELWVLATSLSSGTRAQKARLI